MYIEASRKFIESEEMCGRIYFLISNFFQCRFFLGGRGTKFCHIVTKCGFICQVHARAVSLYYHVKGQNPSATKQTRRLISGLAEARLLAGCGPSAGTGSEIKARLVVVEEDSLLGD